MIRHACTDCGAQYFLLARVGKRLLCVDCWRQAGKPTPRGEGIDHNPEQRTRARMVERGGSDRYRVRAGKT